MNIKAFARSVIAMLKGREFYAQCPCCDEPIQLADTQLFYLDELPPEAEALYAQLREDIRQRRVDLKDREKRMSDSSQSLARAVNLGCILEQLAPSLNGFPYQCGDCRSLFKPIDYVIFRGLSADSRVDSIVFGDIKTGRARLTYVQREIRDLVGDGKVEWDTYTPEVV